MNIGKYVEMFSKDLRLKNYAENTVENYCSQIKIFLKRFESVANKPSEISDLYATVTHFASLFELDHNKMLEMAVDKVVKRQTDPNYKRFRK